jgi:pimeloyl-ACP methyl ester carboxylesterase
MGADRRMFPAPWPTLQDFIAHDWMTHTGEPSLAAVAEAMCTARNIRDGDSLIGTSLGGMVAGEITKIRNIKKLFLVGSAVRKEEINRLLAALHPLAQVTPLDWLRFSAGKIPHELAQMFAQAESSFIRAMCAAVFAWPGLAATATKVYRIHGRHDLVIPAPAAVDLLLEGGHLISITHAKECVEFIRTELSLSRSAAGN